MLIITGCSKYSDIRVRDAKVEKFKVTSLSGAEATIKLTIDNPSGDTLWVDHIEGEICNGGLSFANLYSPSEITIDPGQCEVSCVVDISLSLSASIISFAGGFNESDIEKLTANLKAKVHRKRGKGGITLRKREIPLVDMAGKLKL